MLSLNRVRGELLDLDPIGKAMIAESAGSSCT
jgi:hypothetical protein